MKKKIVHIVEAFGGGVFTYLVDLINATINEFDITVIYSQREQTPQNFEQYFDSKVKFIESKYLKRDIKILNEIRAIQEIKRVLKSIKPDVVHLHSSKAGIIGRIAVDTKKTNIIYNPHGFSFLIQNISSLKKMIYWSIEKIAAFKKSIIVGCSQGEYQEALKLTKNSICINNSINIEKLEEKIKKLRERQTDYTNLKICTSGRIGYQKNPKLFNQIAQKFPQLQFTWIGDGELREELTSKNIQITGWKTRDEVLKILNENDIFILLSLWEGLPIALLEAMYMKKICIVSNVIGNRDAIQHEENGFIANNLNEYINNIQNIIQNRKCEKIKDTAHKDILKKYDMKTMINEYITLYERKEK